MKKLLLLLSLSVIGFSSHAQSISEQGCGTPPPSEEDMQQIRDFVATGISAKARAKTTAVDSIPLTIHIVGQNDGSGYYDINTLFPLICNLNTQYTPVGFYFFIAWPIRYINNTNFYDHNIGGGYQMMLGNNVPNTVNVYFVDDPAGNCGYFYKPGNAVAIAKSCASANSTTVTHELGHFFNLPHTFLKWEGGTPSAADQENVARTGANANCNSTADLFCDTPPDYISNRWNCPYTGTQLMDPTGATFTPDGTFYMSYSNDACQNKFSTQQIGAMQNNLYGVRTDLFTGAYPVYSAMSVPVITAPVSVMYSNTKTVSWNPVPGAEYYLVKISTQANPSLVQQEALTSTTSLNVTINLFPGTNYLVTITPYRGKNVCGTMTASQVFTYSTATSINDIDISNTNFTIAPNPASDNVSIAVADLKKGEYQLQIMSMTGQVVKQTHFAHSGGNANTSLQLNELSNGIYSIKLSGGGITAVKKLVIQH